jgi:hypothetical protein
MLDPRGKIGSRDGGMRMLNNPARSSFVIYRRAKPRSWYRSVERGEQQPLRGANEAVLGTARLDSSVSNTCMQRRPLIESLIVP